jgi:hypothetical protein
VVIVLKQVHENQYSCLAEIGVLLLKALQWRKFISSCKGCVNLFACVQSPTHPLIMPKSKPSKSRYLRQIVSEFGEHIFP